ncbi:MAG: hydrogen peroxide-inducible genes activator [Beijerinckiaceae bacterium]|nr:hydrogen peroxide-inducible genes activator [Beijerinckiaceae bacterium]
MNLRDLRYVLAVADLSHFGRAAEACHVSQPTLSGQILKLEEELGVSIFERVGRSVRVSRVGEEIVAHARRAVAAADSILSTAQAGRDPLEGSLRLGIIPTLGPYLMPFILPEAARRLPLMPLMLVEDQTERILEPLREGRLDAALIASDPAAGQLVEETLFDEPFWLVLPAGHPLAARTTIASSDLDPKSLLLLSDGHCLRDQALDLCGHPELGGLVNADMRASSLETLLHLTAAGYGVTVVPGLAVHNWRPDERLVLRPMRGPNTSRRVRLVWRRQSARAKALHALADLLRHCVPEDMLRIE